jgi:hypothetical protein
MGGGQIAIAGRPRVGAWGVAVLLLGFVGGVIGWLDLKHDDPRRADHILKWGIIWSVVWFFLLVVFWLSLQTLGTGSGGSGHGGPLKLHG